MKINREYNEGDGFWVQFLRTVDAPSLRSRTIDDTDYYSIIFNSQIRHSLQILLDGRSPEDGLWLAMLADMSLEKIRVSSIGDNKDVVDIYRKAKEHVAKVIRSYFHDTILVN